MDKPTCPNCEHILSIYQNESGIWIKCEHCSQVNYCIDIKINSKECLRRNCRDCAYIRWYTPYTGYTLDETYYACDDGKRRVDPKDLACMHFKCGKCGSSLIHGFGMHMVYLNKRKEV